MYDNVHDIYYYYKNTEQGWQTTEQNWWKQMK